MNRLIVAGSILLCLASPSFAFLGRSAKAPIATVSSQTKSVLCASSKRGGSTASKTVRPLKALNVQVKPKPASSKTIEIIEQEPFEFAPAEVIEKPEDSEPLTVTSATALVAGTTVGAGILALPAYCIRAGFLPSSGVLIGAWLYMVSSSDTYASGPHHHY